jgi:hypothetical protein
MPDAISLQPAEIGRLSRPLVQGFGLLPTRRLASGLGVTRTIAAEADELRSEGGSSTISSAIV